MKPCIECGRLTEQSRCPEHKRRTPQRESASARGYPAWWARLSRQAITTQPFCSTCLKPAEPGNPLTLDHSPEAWAEVGKGKRLTMRDVVSGLLTVECLRCNIAKGKSRGEGVTRF